MKYHSEKDDSRQPPNCPALRPLSRSRRTDALHIFVFSGFAIAQPLFDRLSTHSAYLAAVDLPRAAAPLLALLLSFALPAFIVICEAGAARLSRRSYEGAHAVSLFVLATLTLLPFLKRCAFLPGPLIGGTALFISVASIWAYFRYGPVHSIVTAAFPSIVIFPLIFLTQPGVFALTYPTQTGRVEQWRPVPVVMLVLDEFSGLSLLDDRREIDAERFPNFAELARHTTWFRNATTVHDDTYQAVPAILSGTVVRTAGPPVPADLPQNLFSLLQSTGAYESAIFEPVSNLAPRQQGIGQAVRSSWQQAVSVLDTLGRAFLYHVVPNDYYDRLPLLPRLWFGLRDSFEVDPTLLRGVFRYEWDDRRHLQFAHFLRCIDETSAPTLHFMHLILPHFPWSYLPSGRQYCEDTGVFDLLECSGHMGTPGVWGDDELALVHCQQRYLLQVGYVDALIGDLLARLRETGLWDRCLLIVTADHGVSFRANHPGRQPSSGNLPDILSVPLFIKKPFQVEGAASDRNVESIDILPTIADVLGVKLNRPVEGQSVFSLHSERPCKRLVPNASEEMLIDKRILEQSDGSHLQISRFGGGRDRDGLYRIGPHPDLLGCCVQDFKLSSARPVEIEFVRSDATIRNERESILLPCYIEGRVRSPASRTDQFGLVVAVNGIIQAVTRPYLADGLRDRFAAMIPESAFQPGDNAVKIYAVYSVSHEPELCECLVR